MRRVYDLYLNKLDSHCGCNIEESGSEVQYIGENNHDLRANEKGFFVDSENWVSESETDDHNRDSEKYILWRRNVAQSKSGILLDDNEKNRWM